MFGGTQGRGWLGCSAHLGTGPRRSGGLQLLSRYQLSEEELSVASHLLNVSGLLKIGTSERVDAGRQAPEQTLIVRNRDDLLVRDDKLDNFYLQASTQWDGLTHMGCARQGFYNGVTEEQVTQEEGTRNGIENVAEFGLVGRGVLVDLVRHFEKTGRNWGPMEQQVATAKDVRACLDAEGVTLRQGDILMVRMGWVKALLDGKTAEERDGLVRPWAYSGLSGQEDMWEFLWENRVAALASDTITVEVWPLKKGQCSLHLAIARLGITIGEMFNFEALAEDCAKTGNYLSMFTSSPLNVRGGVGSPPNAIAIR